MSDFILVHPNNKLTKVNNLTIPNLEAYKASIKSQVAELQDPVSSKDSDLLTSVDENRLQRLIDFKASELRYIESYLKILKSLDAICKTCQISGSNDYDYEREDEILNNIENEMKNFRTIESELAKNKQLFDTDGKVSSTDLVDTSRRESIAQLERSLSIL